MDKGELLDSLEQIRPELDRLLAEMRMGEPDWEPLEATIPYEWCGSFMFMGYSREIRLYKHGLTRRYLNVDPQGNTYRYVHDGSDDHPGHYVPQPRAEAIKHVFEHLKEMGYTRNGDHIAMRADRQRRIADAGWTTITFGPDAG
jgi:hypothetical protein